jgi:glycosyltransferase involved in cell wall biosynthesis
MAGNGETQRARALVAEKNLSDIIEVRDWVNPKQRDELLAASELFFLPSYREGLPMSMLEAMAWGLAPICSPVGSVAEVILHESNGMLVPPGDIDALAQALSELVLNDRKRATMGAAARARVEPLSASRYIERLVAVYAAVASGRPIADLSA